MSLPPPSTNAGCDGARSSVCFLSLTGLLTLIPGPIHSFLTEGGSQVIAAPLAAVFLILPLRRTRT